jgi:hypothetical protein
MKRIVLVLSLTVLMTALIVWPVGAEEHGAFIDKQVGCGLITGGPDLFTNDAHSVITPSGNTMLICQFKGEPIPQTVTGEGFVCNTYLGLTTESHFVRTQSGDATLTCRINPGI